MTATAIEYARIEKRDGVAIITMDDPTTRNANSSTEIIDALCRAIEDAGSDPALGAVVFTGAGSTFSSGGEVKLMESFQQKTPLEVRTFYMRQGIHRLTRALLALELPTIAAVNGPAYGSGFGMALMCDMRIASTTASFTMNFAKLGILPGDGGAIFLMRAVGHQQAAKILFTGNTVDAAAALEMGIVLEVVPPDQVMDKAMQLARDIAANPSENMRLMKRLVRHAHLTEVDTFIDMTVSMQALSHHTAEHRDSLRALREKLSRKKST